MKIAAPSIEAVTSVGQTGARAAGDADAARTAKQFEALFLTQTVETMLETVKLGDMSGGQAEEMWRSFLAQAIADQVAGEGVTGIAQSVEGAISNYGKAGVAK